MLNISDKVSYLSHARFIDNNQTRLEYLANSYRLFIICDGVNEYFENKWHHAY